LAQFGAFAVSPYFKGDEVQRAGGYAAAATGAAFGVDRGYDEG
jgi:hypothetical protein